MTSAVDSFHLPRKSASRFSLYLAFTLLALLPLTGCDHLRLALGMRTSLAKVDVTSMAPTLPAGPAIAPGQSSPLMITFTDAKGKIWTTEGAGHGKIQWRDITVTPTVVTAKKGIISLRHDPRATLGQTGSLAITLPSHPNIAASSLTVPLTYAYPFVAAYYGASGSNGTDGTSGTDGSSGSAGSTDPDNPSAGGNGGDGTAGGNGSDGSDGGSGPAVDVWITLMPNTQAHPLLEAKVVTIPANSKHPEHFFLIDAQGGSLTIKSLGGSGGSGGKGGRGGSGGSGGSGSPPGSSGSSGSNGMDGSNGSDGSNGPVTVTYDPSVKPFLTSILVAKNSASTITFSEGTVAPLW